MKSMVYSKIAEFICLICHGMCCYRGTIQFEWNGYKLKFTGWEPIKCTAYNTLTGRCKVHNTKKPKLCKVYKCQMLNFISRIFKQKIWDGEWFR